MKTARRLPPMWFAVGAAVLCAAAIVTGGLVTSMSPHHPRPTAPESIDLVVMNTEGASRAAVAASLTHQLLGWVFVAAGAGLGVWTLAGDQRRWMRAAGGVATFGPLAEGAIGQWTVGANREPVHEAVLAGSIAHALLAPLMFAATAVLVVGHLPLVRKGLRLRPDERIDRLRKVSLVLGGTLLVQLALGAVYRHTQSGHAFWGHIGFALVIVVLTIAASMLTIRMSRAGKGQTPPVPGDVHALGKVLRVLGAALLVATALQFGMGWLTVGAGESARSPQQWVAATIRTAHQSNGALLAALAAAIVTAALWMKSSISRDPAVPE